MSEDKNCFFCNSTCKASIMPEKSYSIAYCCNYCGDYLLDPQDSTRLSNQSDSKFKIACVLNERRLKGLGGIALSDKTDKVSKVCGYPQVSIDDILDEFPKKASDSFNRTILNLSRLAKRPFEGIKLEVNMAHLLLFMSEHEECNAFLRELAQQGFIRFLESKRGPQLRHFFLTPKFWEKEERLQKEEVDNKRAFVAMWFDESMDDYFKDGIKKAIKDAGYEPVRIDLKDFNGKICDEIIAEIKRCKFLVSDFSGQRGGVYFEAGFAQGLGRPTIFTVKKDDVGNLHFDTRQYNHIVYDSPEDLRKQLYNRICATIV